MCNCGLLYHAFAHPVLTGWSRHPDCLQHPTCHHVLCSHQRLDMDSLHTREPGSGRTDATDWLYPGICLISHLRTQCKVCERTLDLTNPGQNACLLFKILFKFLLVCSHFGKFHHGPQLINISAAETISPFLTKLYTFLIPNLFACDSTK